MDARKFLAKSFRILRYAQNFWKLMLWLFIISVILTALGLVSPYLIKILIDVVLPQKNLTLLLYLMLAFISIFIFKTVVGIYHSYKTTALAENIVLGVKKQLFEHIENLHVGFFTEKNIGDILVRIDDDVYAIDDFVSIVVDDILMNALTLIFVVGICLFLSWKVTLSALLFFPFYFFSQHFFGKAIKRRQMSIIRKGGDILGFLQENISAISAIKAFVLEKASLERYVEKTKRLITLDLDMALLRGYFGAIVGIITFIPLLIILWYGSHLVIEDVITLGTLIAIYTYIGKLFDPLATIGSININIQSTMVSVDRVFEFLDTVPEIADKENAKHLKKVKGDIVFEDISFSYNPKEPVLKDVSFRIKHGETVGIVGPSGAGKTAIGNLIARFYDAGRGSVKIDGNDVKDVSIKSLRSNIGIVSQEPVLFNTTIMNNIKLGNLNASDRKAKKAAKLAKIHEFIMSLEKGYDSVVGERGVKLSGGQKQMIAIARVILKNPKVFIFDEATSSLDAASENNIQKSLSYVAKGRTTIIIAHRLSTIKNADRIFVLKNKTIVEEGMFDELVQKKGEFYRLYKSQF